VKTIGPTFGNELKTAGVNCEGVSWGADGQICYREDVSKETIAAVESVYADHDPEAKLPIEPASISDGDLAAILVAKGMLAQADINAKLQSNETLQASPSPA
jgi:hypothetical protein